MFFQLQEGPVSYPIELNERIDVSTSNELKGSD